MLWRLVRDSAAIAIGDSGGAVRSTGNHARGNFGAAFGGIGWLDSPETTSPTIYKYQVRAGAGSVAYINRDISDNRFVSSITVIEVAA